MAVLPGYCVSSLIMTLPPDTAKSLFTTQLKLCVQYVIAHYYGRPHPSKYCTSFYWALFGVLLAVTATQEMYEYITRVHFNYF